MLVCNTSSGGITTEGLVSRTISQLLIMNRSINTQVLSMRTLEIGEHSKQAPVAS